MKKIVIDFEDSTIKIKKENMGTLEMIGMLQDVLDSAVTEYNKSRTINPSSLILDANKTIH